MTSKGRPTTAQRNGCGHNKAREEENRRESKRRAYEREQDGVHPSSPYNRKIPVK